MRKETLPGDKFGVGNEIKRELFTILAAHSDSPYGDQQSCSFQVDNHGGCSTFLIESSIVSLCHVLPCCSRPLMKVGLWAAKYVLKPMEHSKALHNIIPWKPIFVRWSD